MTTTPLLTTLTSLPNPHIPLGIVQGYSQDQLGLGNRFGASIANIFGGNSSLNEGIGSKFVNLKANALEELQSKTQEKYPQCDCIAGIQFELLTIDINQGNDTILVCNVTGTPVKYTDGEKLFRSVSHTRKSQRRHKSS